MLKRVMVFGSTGQGKSSLINLLSGRFDAKTGNDAEGVTTDLSEYPAKSPDGVSYTLVDTAGLNEANDGTVPAMQAFLQLTRILRDTKSQGFCLALMVTQTSRLSDQAFAQNYEIFVNCMLKGKVNMDVCDLIALPPCIAIMSLLRTMINIKDCHPKLLTQLCFADLGVLGVPVILVKLGCELLSDWKTGWYCKASPEGRSVKELIKDRYPAFHDVVGGTGQPLLCIMLVPCGATNRSAAPIGSNYTHGSLYE